MATILIERNAMVPMCDGVRLAIDIYRLEGSDPMPVMVARIPYNPIRAAQSPLSKP